MRKDDLILVGFPFVLSATVIFAHYRLLATSNPEAHSRPLITTRAVQTLRESEIKPVAPQAPFPNNLVGVMYEIPTSKKELQELLEISKSQGANTLLLRVGMTLTADGNLILTQAAETSEEAILLWTKKTVSDAHKEGFHTYLALMFVEEPAIVDAGKFSSQLKSLIERWANTAQEYFIPFFDPGIIVGHPTYQSLPQDRLAVFITEIERHTRQFYTGRIGIGLCCIESVTTTRGYNQITISSRSGKPSESLLQQASIKAQRDGIEHVYLLDLEAQRISTIK